ncbi:MAG TPA: cytochrome c oxidase subunit II [Devosiaceae bacterium]
MLLRLFKVVLLAMTAFLPVSAFAETGHPQPGEIGFQGSVTPIMDSIRSFHDGMLIWIISAITILVLVLLLIVMFRFNAKANPTPSKTSHNTVIEIVWTVVPILILVIIAVPSFGVLADQMTVPDGQRHYLGSQIFSRGSGEVLPAPGLTVKVIGNQWHWSYEYPDNGDVTYDSYMLTDEERAAQKPDQPRLLAVDEELVVPVDTTVRVQVTASDVIHSFAVPSFGVKVDAVPGRLNETWFYVRKTGIYYGQCSELCGKDHAFMPIAVRVVSKEEFANWVKTLQDQGDVDAANKTLAAL